MAAISDFLENKLVDQIFKATAYIFPTVMAFALFAVNKGQRANSTLYVVTTDFIWLTANDGKTHIYKCTTAGTSAAAQASLYPGTANEAITDGTAVFTEQSSAMDANTLTANEVSTTATGYARVALNPSATANWNNTQGAATGASTGTGGTTTNASAVTFGTPTATWGGTNAHVAAFAIYDATTAGNLLFWGYLTAPQAVNSGAQPPSIAIGALSLQLDN